MINLILMIIYYFITRLNAFIYQVLDESKLHNLI